MKKPFLLIALAATAAVMSAQTFKPIPELEKGRILSVGEPAMTCRNIGNIQQRAPKSVSTGVYYNRPVGTFYYPTSQVTYLLVPPLADMTFRNASKSKRATVWYKDGEPQTADYDYNFTTNYAIPDDPDRLFRFPYLKLGADTFALGDGNNSNYTNGVVINSEVQNLAYFDMSLTGGYAVTNPNAFNGIQHRFGGFWHVGLQVRIPIWNWGDVKYKVQAAQEATTVANLELEDAREKIELQVSQNRFRVSEANKNLALAKSNIASAEENLRMAKRGFEEGVVTPTTVMEAQSAWLMAHTQKIDAEIELQLSNTDLLKALGILK